MLLLLLLFVVGIEVELLITRKSRIHLLVIDDAGGDEAVNFLVDSANFSTDLEDKACGYCDKNSKQTGARTQMML